MYQKSSVGSLLTRAVESYRNLNVAVRASLWFTVCSVIQRGISVITMPIFTRLMSTEQYGRYNVYLSWYNILLILVTCNVHTEIFNKGLIDHEGEKDRYTANQVGLLLTLAAGWLLVYLTFRKLFNRLLGMTTILVIFLLLEILGSAIIGLWSARRRFSYDYGRIVKLTLMMAVSNPLVGIAAVLLSEQKAEMRLIANAVVPGLFAAVLLLQLRKQGRFFGRRDWWKAAMLSALPLIPHYMSLVLLNQSDKLMIDHYIGAEDAALYSVAHSAGLLLTIINTSINGSFVPWSYDSLKKRGGSGIRRLSGMLFLLVAAVNALLIWVAPEIVRLLAAPQYQPAAWCLVPIAMSVFFFFAYTLFVDLEIYYGKNRLIAAASVSAAGLNILLNAIFIPRFGYLAAGYTTLFSYFFTMLMHFVFLAHTLKGKRRVGELFDLRMLCFSGIGLVLLSALSMLLFDYPWLRLGTVAVVLTAAFWKRKKIASLLREMKKR